MAYTVPTFAQAVTDLAVRLNDAGKVRWVDAELKVYVKEALRTWASFTSYFRSPAIFTTVMGSTFYDLATVLNPALRAYTVTLYELIADIQYALLEPATPSAWTGTNQFTLAQVTEAIEDRRNSFLRETGIVQSTAQYVEPNPPLTGLLTLSETTMAIRRATWTPSVTGIRRVLQRDDQWGADHYSPFWTLVPGFPAQYAVSVTPPLDIQLIPPPQGQGTLDLVQITRGDPIVAGTDALVGIPDDWVWVLKWGVLAALLANDGLARDPARSAYCEMRWTQGLDAAKKAPVVLSAQIEGTPVRVDGLSDADAYSPFWSLVAGIPTRLLLAGQNLIATWPPAGAKPVFGGDFTVRLDVVRNAPAPTADADPLGVGPELLDTILDYAQHLAMFKDGPPAVALSQGLLERFLASAGQTLSMQQAQQPARAPMVGQQTQDTGTVAYELPLVGTGR